MSSSALADTKLDYAYINNINSIFGDEKNVGLFDDGVVEVRGHLFNAEYKGLPIGTISAYAQLIDYDDDETLSNKIIGASLNGPLPITENVNMLYTAEYAQQDVYKDGMTDDLDYYLAKIGGKYKAWLAKVSHEVQ